MLTATRPGFLSGKSIKTRWEGRMSLKTDIGEVPGGPGIAIAPQGPVGKSRGNFGRNALTRGNRGPQALAIRRHSERILAFQ